MILCSCRAVSDRAVREAVRVGARSMGGVARATGGGSCCGGCVASVRAVLLHELERCAPAPAGEGDADRYETGLPLAAK